MNKSPEQLAREIIACPFSWPGGYERWAVTDDGGLLCRTCCEEELPTIIESYPGDGWHIVGTMAACDTDEALTCDHCGTDLPAK